jgi:3-phenylpropionate/trans-cinnamate dioxygenase ferredoxin subunit
MTRFVRAAELSKVPEGGRWLAFVEGKGIVLFNVGGEIFALEDSCPHFGASLFAGKLEGSTVKCRAHGMRFDLRTGRMPGEGGLCATTYPVSIEGGVVHVGIE